MDQLTKLRDALQLLVQILSLDYECQWRNHFANCLSEAENLLLHEFEQSDLNGLSVSVRGVYGGSGSFSDYSPLDFDPKSNTCKPIKGTESFSQASGDVYHWADELRVIGRY